MGCPVARVFLVLRCRELDCPAALPVAGGTRNRGRHLRHGHGRAQVIRHEWIMKTKSVSLGIVIQRSRPGSIDCYRGEF